MTSIVARPPRPATVAVAFWLQLAAVAVLLAVVGVAVTGAVLFDAEISRVADLVGNADPAEVRGERMGNVVGALIAAAPATLLAIWLAATAWPLRAGNRTARILVYVAGGAQLVLLCTQTCAGALFLPLTLVLAAGPMEADHPAGGAPPMGPDEVPWENSAFLDVLYADNGPLTELSFVASWIGVPLLVVLTAAVLVLVSVPPAGRYFGPGPARAS